MQKEKGAETAETGAKSPDTNNLTKFQAEFNAALEKWKIEGCTVVIDGGTKSEKFCGGKPHKTKLNKADENGICRMDVNCEHGHENVWHFDVAEADLKDELKRQIEARAKAEENAGKDPLKASVKITLDLRTQEVEIDPWVPTPGVGLQLAGMLTAHFSRQFNMGTKPAPKSPIVNPTPKGILHPSTGKLIVQ